MTAEELEIWKRLNKCECVKRAYDKGWDYDQWIHDDADKRMYWTPLLYDRRCPERSLIGMIKSMAVYIDRNADGHWVCGYFNGTEVVERSSVRPDLVLAEVIIEQEEK